MNNDDVLGFSREARQGSSDGRLCIAMLEALSDQMAAEGITGDPLELQRRARQVFAGQRQCPNLGSCPRAQHLAGRKLIWQRPVQLNFF